MRRAHRYLSAFVLALVVGGVVDSGADTDELGLTLLFESDNRGYIEECG